MSKENNYCHCANSNISELLNISITQVSKLVNSLKKKGYIDIEIKYKENSKEIESRKLIPKMDTPYLTKVKYPPPNKTSIPLLKKSLKIINIIRRNEKLIRAESYGAYVHNDRKAKNHSNKDINPTRTHLNFYCKENETTYIREFDRMKKKYDLKNIVN